MNWHRRRSARSGIGGGQLACAAKLNELKQSKSIRLILINLHSLFLFLSLSVIDSIGRPTSGILEGRLTYLGRYDECIAARSSNSGSVTSEKVSVPAFSGKYCIAHIHLPGNYSDSLSVSVCFINWERPRLCYCNCFLSHSLLFYLTEHLRNFSGPAEERSHQVGRLPAVHVLGGRRQHVSPSV